MKEDNQKKRKIIKAIIELIIVVILLYVLVIVYKNNNFNDFVKAESTLGTSVFSRDGDTKYSDMYSYKIVNKEYNDAMFYKSIKVNPNTPYKVTCMVKTQDVLNKDVKDGGAHISINGTTEKSKTVSGTSDWQKIEFIFNSKNRENIEIGFRLGGYETDSIGTAWFSDMTIESGINDFGPDWKFLCLIFENTDVSVKINKEEKNIKLSLNDIDINDMKVSFNRFTESLGTLSKGKINATGTIDYVKEPLRKMSYSDDNGYYVAPSDIEDILDKYIDTGKYDHIFVVFKTGDINKNIEIPVNDWIGLGSMEYRNIGFSNIRVPSDENSYIYKYDTRINTFPEEVYVHEFLHTLEKNAEDYGYKRPELHSNKEYGYENERLVGLKVWYEDYMNACIKNAPASTGLPSEIFEKKPTKTSNFIYTHKLNYFSEPENIIEELNAFIYKITSTASSIMGQNK